MKLFVSACRCNNVGSLGPNCSKLGGICECKPNVIGRCCDTCAPLTFGFGSDGCQREQLSLTSFSALRHKHDKMTIPLLVFAACDCDPRGSVSELCDQVRGQCACRSEVTGRRCDHCRTGHWDFPLCRPCECNGHSEVCDDVTGECRNCREHTTGPNCDRSPFLLFRTSPKQQKTKTSCFTFHLS